MTLKNLEQEILEEFDEKFIFMVNGKHLDLRIANGPQIKSFISQSLSRQREAMAEIVMDLRVPSDWNKGHKTKKRHNEILQREGTIMSLYNQVLDDVVKQLETPK